LRRHHPARPGRRRFPDGPVPHPGGHAVERRSHTMKRTTDPNPPAGMDMLSSALVADRRSGGFSLVPTRVFFTKGVGSHRDELRSFELALKDAGIEKLNLVHVSSIFPPKCKIIPKDEGVKLIAPGDRKSTRLNSSHVAISYAVFCLKKKSTI